jgi:hypothetical protein
VLGVLIREFAYKTTDPMLQDLLSRDHALGMWLTTDNFRRDLAVCELVPISIHLIDPAEKERVDPSNLNCTSSCDQGTVLKWFL